MAKKLKVILVLLFMVITLLGANVQESFADPDDVEIPTPTEPHTP